MGNCASKKDYNIPEWCIREPTTHKDNILIMRSYNIRNTSTFLLVTDMVDEYGIMTPKNKNNNIRIFSVKVFEMLERSLSLSITDKENFIAEIMAILVDNPENYTRKRYREIICQFYKKYPFDYNFYNVLGLSIINTIQELCEKKAWKDDMKKAWVKRYTKFFIIISPLLNKKT